MRFPINVSLDTNVFEKCQYSFKESSSLNTLKKYIDDNKIQIHLSNVVINEIKKHSIESIEEIIKDSQKIQKKSHKFALNSISLIPDKQVLLKEADAFLEELCIKLDALILSYEGIDIASLFEDYFERIPPFEESKKSEFPDALIALQLKENFNKDNPVILITQDEGLKKAMISCEYCTVFPSLNELFDSISKTDKEYSIITKIVESFIPDISAIINEKLIDNSDELINLTGLEYDRKGNTEGFDYDDVYYDNIEVENVNLFTIDYFDDNTIEARLKCSANITATCYYDDYENAQWDSEEKEYLFLDTISNIEVHKANFACFVRIDRNNNCVLELKFHVYLGGSSRIQRYIGTNSYTTCPDCGIDIHLQNDGGNGFCIDCAPNH